MDVFGKLAARCRHETSLSVPEPMRQPLSADERDGLAIWVRGQRSATQPERGSWAAFWNGRTPFFSRELSFLLSGQVSTNILQCAEPLRDPSMLRHWSALDAGQRFTLERVDACRCLFFDAEFLLVMDRQRPIDAWRFGPAVEPDGTRGTSSTWQTIGPPDLLDVLLLVWESSQPKAKFARERLCDIADKALTLRP